MYCILTFLTTFILAFTPFVTPHGLYSYSSFVPIRAANPQLFKYKEPPCHPRPGIVGLRAGGWRGGVNLAHLPANIRVETEFLNPGWAHVWLPIERIRSDIEFELKTVGITTKAPCFEPSDPYRPILHLQTHVYPCECGYMVMAELQLLERNEEFSRAKTTGSEYWQVITWQQKRMFVSTPGNLVENLRCNVHSMTDLFTRTYILHNREALAALHGTGNGVGSDTTPSSHHPDTSIPPRPSGPRDLLPGQFSIHPNQDPQRDRTVVPKAPSQQPPPLATTREISWVGPSAKPSSHRSYYR